MSSMFRSPLDMTSDPDTSSAPQEDEEPDPVPLEHKESATETVEDVAADRMNELDDDMSWFHDLPARAHGHVIAQSVLQVYWHQRAAEFLNSNSGDDSNKYTRFSPRAVALGNQMYRQQAALLASAGVMGESLADEEFDTLRRSYLEGLDSLGQQALEGGTHEPPERALSPLLRTAHARGGLQPRSRSALRRRLLPARPLDAQALPSIEQTMSRSLDAQAFPSIEQTMSSTRLGPASPLAASPAASFPLPSSSQPAPQSHVFMSRYATEFAEIKVLGKGGYGKVYHVLNHVDGQEYAVKKIILTQKRFKKLQEGTIQELEGILKEIRTLARMEHPNVVRYMSAWIERTMGDIPIPPPAPSSVGVSTPRRMTSPPFLIQDSPSRFNKDTSLEIFFEDSGSAHNEEGSDHDGIDDSSSDGDDENVSQNLTESVARGDEGVDIVFEESHDELDLQGETADDSNDDEKAPEDVAEPFSEGYGLDVLFETSKAMVDLHTEISVHDDSNDGKSLDFMEPTPEGRGGLDIFFETSKDKMSKGEVDLHAEIAGKLNKCATDDEDATDSRKSKDRRPGRATIASIRSKKSTVRNTGDDDDEEIEAIPRSQDFLSPGQTTTLGYADEEDIFSDGLGERDTRLIAEEKKPDGPTVVLHIQMSLHPRSLLTYLNPPSSSEASVVKERHCYHLITSIRLLLAILAGTEYLHSKGIVHRDLKPGNIFLAETVTPITLHNSVNVNDCPQCDDPKGTTTTDAYYITPRIGDFGLVAEISALNHPPAAPPAEAEAAAAAHLASSLSCPPVKPVGTEFYRPPLRAASIDEKLDVYSLGVVLFELLWKFDTRMERHMVLAGLGRGVLPEDFARNVGKGGKEVAECIHGMLRADPEERWGCARVREALHQIVREFG